jgi:hypothetical protein
VVYVPDAPMAATVPVDSAPLPKTPLTLVAATPASLIGAAEPWRPRWPIPAVLPLARPLATTPPAPTVLTDAGEARQSPLWQQGANNKNGLDLDGLRGPAVIGTVLAGAALATGVGIDLSRGTLFAPATTARAGIKLSGSPSFDGGSISISGRF